MITDEGQQRAAYSMQQAAELNMAAAQCFADNINRLTALIGQGYGNNLEQLIELLQARAAIDAARQPGDTTK